MLASCTATIDGFKISDPDLGVDIIRADVLVSGSSFSYVSLNPHYLGTLFFSPYPLRILSLSSDPLLYLLSSRLLCSQRESPSTAISIAAPRRHGDVSATVTMILFYSLLEHLLPLKELSME
jgi:hypothetical protein